MILNAIRPGSFEVTWFVPISFIDTLAQKKEIVFDMLVDLIVTRLTLNGNCIFEQAMST